MLNVVVVVVTTDFLTSVGSGDLVVCVNLRSPRFITASSVVNVLGYVLSKLLCVPRWFCMIKVANRSWISYTLEGENGSVLGFDEGLRNPLFSPSQMADPRQWPSSLMYTPGVKRWTTFLKISKPISRCYETWWYEGKDWFKGLLLGVSVGSHLDVTFRSRFSLRSRYPITKVGSLPWKTCSFGSSSNFWQRIYLFPSPNRPVWMCIICPLLKGFWYSSK